MLAINNYKNPGCFQEGDSRRYIKSKFSKLNLKMNNGIKLYKN